MRGLFSRKITMPPIKSTCASSQQYMRIFLMSDEVDLIVSCFHADGLSLFQKDNTPVYQDATLGLRNDTGAFIRL